MPAAGARLIATALRVRSVDTALPVYLQGLGMATLPTDGGGGCLVGYRGEGRGAPIRLLEESGAELVPGTGFGHVAVSVDDVPLAFDGLLELGAEPAIAPGVMVPGGPRCAFVRDRDGCSIELVETHHPTQGALDQPAAPRFDPDAVVLGPDDGHPRLLHAMLRVADLAESLRFYVEALGLHERTRIEIPLHGGITAAFVGGDEPGGQLELTWFHARADRYAPGDHLAHLAFAVDDVAAVTARLAALGYPARNGMIRDPDGYPIRLFQG